MDRQDDKQFKNDKKKPLPRDRREEHDYRKDYKTRPIKKTETIKGGKKDDTSPHGPNTSQKMMVAVPRYQRSQLLRAL
jgi:hypothetical protein